jgi:hypothetical protein
LLASLWLIENVHSTAAVEDLWEAKQLALRCMEAAENEGITRSDLEKAAGEDLVKCMLDAQVAIADAGSDRFG